jgi:hypothetical protein
MFFARGACYLFALRLNWHFGYSLQAIWSAPASGDKTLPVVELRELLAGSKYADEKAQILEGVGKSLDEQLVQLADEYIFANLIRFAPGSP